MYFNALIFFSVLAIVVATAIPDAAQFEALPQVLHGGEALANAPPALNARHLMKRACYYNGCRCNIGEEGLACYGDNVYQCAPDGNCCSFGYRQSCHECGQLSC